MSLKKITNEYILYSAVFFLAIFLRLLNLGDFPLTDHEASLAMQAQQITQATISREAYVNSQPIYSFLTSLTFLLFKPSNFLARFWPAFAGSLLVLSAFLLRKNLGRTTALILACGLALDPGLVALSRQAGSSIMALSFFALALGFWNKQKPIPTGIMAGLALLSGQAIWKAILIGLVGWLMLKHKAKPAMDRSTLVTQTSHWKIVFFSGLVTMLACSTFLWRFPMGIMGWINSITEFLNGFSHYSETSGWRLLVTTWAYQPFAWLFAIISSIRMIYNWVILKIAPGSKTIILLTYSVLALAFTLAYPNHNPNDLVWFLYLLWAIAASEISQWLEFKEKPVISAIQAAMILVFGAMFWNTITSVFQVPPQEGVPWVLLQALVITGIIGLAGLSAILISYTWTWSISRSGLVAGAIITGLIYTLAVLWSATQIRPNSAVELWNSEPTIAQTKLFMKTIQDLSTRKTGRNNDIDVVVTLDTPAMRWLLRDFDHVGFMPQIPTNYQPSLIITPATQESPALSAAYRGQDFSWQVHPGWTGALPDDFIQWLTFRKAVEQKDQIILWARVDLFSGEQLKIQPNSDG